MISIISANNRELIEKWYWHCFNDVTRVIINLLFYYPINLNGILDIYLFESLYHCFL